MTSKRNAVASFVPLTVETTATKYLNSSAKTITSPSSSSITPGYSLQKPPLPSLTLDLVVEILCWLPVKSLMQFRCICKSWKSVISDSKFAKKQLHAAMSNTSHHHLILTSINLSSNRSCNFFLTACSLSSVFAEGTTSAMLLEYPLNKKLFHHVVGSCHGILCIRHGQGLLLWNPSIRKFYILPPVEKGSDSSSYNFSFGYDNFSDTYKTVAVSCYHSYINGIRAYKYKVKVHTLGKSWKNIQDFPFANSNLLNRDGNFVSGTINWLVSRHSHSSRVIVSLDFQKESYRELLLPDFGGVAMVALNLGIFKDCLCIFSNYDNFSDVWVMKEFGNEESWTELFRVHYREDLGPCPYVSALYISEDDQVLLDIEPELVVYNSRNGTVKNTDIDVRRTHSWIDSEVYVESLISPYF